MLKNKKRILIIVAILCVVFVTIMITVKVNENNRIQKINQNCEKWKQSAVVFPETGSLQPAGYITIEWNNADKLGKVKGYKVYADDKKIAETDGKTTTCEYYSTEVKLHKIYIEADLEKGAQIYSDIFSFYVNKKGLCMNKDMARKVNADDWNVSWYYNWSLSKHNYTSFQKLQFVPMFWTSAPTDEKEVEVLPMLGYKYLLAFNEPDREDQSNMEVDTAIEGMKSIVNKGLRVGSPAVAVWPSISTDWFQPFMKKMEQEKMDVDFIALHHYWNWYNEEGVQAFLDIIDETWEMYHKPIWITEFALSGVPNWTEQTRQSAIDYMKGVLPELDKREYVERYAWFSFESTDYKNGGSSMLNFYTGEISDLGYTYQKLGIPEGYGENKNFQEKNKNKDIIK